ncbi:MAG: M20/M25/M40 family metallo-hydrolase [Acidobacteria bacterium]|nr:M20/M25/M40 family metallo-hydrolase [Acidobacteriota bacterium]
MLTRGVPLAVAIVLSFSWSVSGESTDPSREESSDAVRVRRHLVELTNLGPRPTGSEANAKAAAYLLDAFRRLGARARLQEGVGFYQPRGSSGPVRNVLALLPADAPDPSLAVDGKDIVLVVAHYDSVPGGPGAADDAMSVAAMLAAAEDLAQKEKRKRTVLFLATDGEEQGLLGADLFVREEPLARKVAVAFNFDHAGRAVPLYCFETAPPNRAILAALADLPRYTGHPLALSPAEDVYHAMPADTDFTALKRLSIPGLSIGAIADDYAYHTSRDGEEEVGDEILTALKWTMDGLLRGLVLEGRPVGGEPEHVGNDVVFFQVGPFFVRMGTGAWRLFSITILVLSLVAIWSLVRGMIRAFLRALAAVPVAFGLNFIITWLAVLALARFGAAWQVGYARPLPFFFLLTTLSIIGPMLAGAWLERSDGRTRDIRLAAALVPWALSAAAMTVLMPGSSVLFTLPLAGLVLASVRVREGWPRYGALVAAALALLLLALVWYPFLAAVHPLAVTTFAKFGASPPSFFWPLFAGACSLFLLPLPRAFFPLPKGKGRIIALTATATTAAATIWLISGPPYDDRHPERSWVYHLTENTPNGPRAIWAVSSSDRLPVFASGAPEEVTTPEVAEWFLRGKADVRVLRAEPITPLPLITVAREERTLVVEVSPPPGSTRVGIMVDGARIDSSEPPGQVEGGVLRLLRFMPEADRPSRFVIMGRFTEKTRVFALAGSEGLPGLLDSRGLPAWLPDGPRTWSGRTFAITRLTNPNVAQNNQAR